MQGCPTVIGQLRIQLPIGSKASYMEIGCAGIERAQELYKNDRQEVLDHCNVVLTIISNVP